MNNIEKIEEAIEAKMTEIETYEGIKRPNSYFMLAHLLDQYSEMCILSAENKIIEVY
jgi:hypothetical protein